MISRIFKLLFFLFFFLADAYAQEIIANTCDSSLLTKEELEKCKADSAWTAGIIINSNHIINLKTNLLPKYRVIRKELKIPAPLQESLQELKAIYNTVLNNKLSVFATSMDSNQKYVQPKAYLSSILSLEVFKFYPDVYAVLLNEIHLQLNPRTTPEDQENYKQLFDKIIKFIPAGLYQTLLKISNELTADHSKIVKQGFTQMFQGSIAESYRSKCNVVNFLLWTA